MTFRKAAILTPWTGEGTPDSPHRPLVAEQHNLKSWSDVTRQTSKNLIPDFNLYLINVIVDAKVLDAIQTDPTFFVVWSDDEPEEFPVPVHL